MSGLFLPIDYFQVVFPEIVHEIQTTFFDGELMSKVVPFFKSFFCIANMRRVEKGFDYVIAPLHVQRTLELCNHIITIRLLSMLSFID